MKVFEGSSWDPVSPDDFSPTNVHEYDGKMYKFFSKRGEYEKNYDLSLRLLQGATMICGDSVLVYDKIEGSHVPKTIGQVLEVLY